MIPTEEQARKLWDIYNLPDNKRVHVALVATVARVFAQALIKRGKEVDTALLVASALLHDIDKNVPRLLGERHPETAVRILKEEGMDEVADVIRNHSLHAILDPSTAPKSWEEKVLFLADKMVKYDIVGVDGRFDLWRKENLPAEAVAILNRSYPKVKALEKEMFSVSGIDLSEIRKLATAQ